MFPERASSSERLPVSVSSAVLIEDNNGRLLLLRKKIGDDEFMWTTASGGMEPHEDPKRTAEREVREEIGVEVKLLNIVGIYAIDRGDNTTLK